MRLWRRMRSRDRRRPTRTEAGGELIKRAPRFCAVIARLTSGGYNPLVQGTVEVNADELRTLMRVPGGAMMNTPLTPIHAGKKMADESFPLRVVNTREGKHGGTAWSTPFSERSLRQPQDGAGERRTRLAIINSHLLTNLLNEPEDAGLTGGTRSLTRRLLGLNVITAYAVSSEKEVTESIVQVDVA